MHRDEKFQNSNISKSKFNKIKLYISREKVSRTIYQSGIAVIILAIGIFSAFYIRNNSTIAAESADSLPTVQPTDQIQTTAGYKSINYARPASADELSPDSGGPLDDLTENETEAEEAAMETKLRLIEATGNPAFLPTMWAHLGKINNEFGYRRDPFGGRGYEFHAGLDIDGERGDLVIAPANGIVTKAGWEGGYGNMIEIDHGNGLKTRYGHLSGINVQVSDAIQRGQLIGLIGTTGRSTGPHLHFEVRLNDKAINPRRLLPPEPSEIKALNAR